MGYVGKIPGSYWTWRPNAAAVSDTWNTLVTQFEDGSEQRRGKWDHPLATISFTFGNTMSHDDLADIWRFYKAQRGQLYTFEVPTFGLLTTVASAYPGSGTALGVSDAQGMTSSPTSRWNRLWAENASFAYDIFTVTSVAAASHVEVTATGSAVAFAPGDPIYPVLRCRFAQALQAFQYLPMLLGTVGIQFTEVRS